jgi:alkylation response protein AidB-like acyl-CoA dehydrogenase
MSIAITGVSMARAALGWTLDYVKQRTAFGASIGSFQNTKFVLAEVKTEVDVAQAYIDQCVLALNAGTLDPSEAAEAKLFATELQTRVIDRCVQLFGGYGYMIEYPIARAYIDARVTTIYGGTSEIMKTIIAKSIGL